MYPNQQPQFPGSPTPPQAPPPDYLNQIAPQAPKQSSLKLSLKKVIVLGGILVAAVIALAVTVNVVIGSQRQPLQQIAARLSSIQAIANDAQGNLKSSQLRSTNSNLRISLTNINRDIGAPLLKSGVDVSKLPESILQKESTDGVLGRLEDARLNAVYDRTYAREMTFILSNTLATMRQIENSTGNAELRTLIVNAIEDLDQIQQSFEAFSTSATS